MTNHPLHYRQPAESPVRSILMSGNKPSVSNNQRSVSFCSRIRGRQIEHLDDIPRDQFRRVWYTEHDQQQLVQDTIANIKKMRAAPSQSKAIEDDEFCSRGLEHMANSKVLAEQADAKTRAIEAVLVEQSHQRRSGVSCPTTLATVAAAASDNHQRTAFVRAAEDEVASRRYLRKESSLEALSRAIRIGGPSELHVLKDEPVTRPRATPISRLSGSYKRESSLKLRTEQQQQQQQQRQCRQEQEDYLSQALSQQVLSHQLQNQKRRRSTGTLRVAA